MVATFRCAMASIKVVVVAYDGSDIYIGEEVTMAG